MSLKDTIRAAKTDRVDVKLLASYAKPPQLTKTDSEILKTLLNKINQDVYLWLPRDCLETDDPGGQGQLNPPSVNSYDFIQSCLRAAMRFVIDIDEGRVRYGVQQYPYTKLADGMQFATREFVDKHIVAGEWRGDEKYKNAAITKFRERQLDTSTLIVGTNATIEQIKKEVSDRTPEFKAVFDHLVDQLNAPQTRVASLVFTSTANLRMFTVTKTGSKEEIDAKNLFLRYSVVRVDDTRFAINHFASGIVQRTDRGPGNMTALAGVQGVDQQTFYTLGG